MKKNIIYYLLATMTIVACAAGDTNETSDGSGGNGSNGTSLDGPWLIPKSEVRDGGPGKDGIPSIDNPKFINANEVGFLDDDDLVVGILNENTARAYPHEVLDWHEVVNDKINNDYVTINYCPLTGTAFGWKSESNGEKTSFGVSGLLYNANLILYDRNTDSNWSQLRLQAVNGELIGKEPQLIPVIETSWKTWKTLYPNTKVLSTDTGFSRNYGVYPYGAYKTNHAYFVFQPAILNSALPNKERVLAIINNGKSKVYQFSKFINGKVIKETFEGTDYLIVGNEDMIVPFKLTDTFSTLDFSYDFNNSETFFKDNEGNRWNVFGTAISGPRVGDTLTPAKSVASFWFAIATFYPNPEIY